MKSVLTIAGSDSSGGAGIQADLKTFCAFGVYGSSIITALTAQNTTGVKAIMEVSVDFFEKQLDSVLSDLKIDAVKIGMLYKKEIIDITAEKLIEYNIKNIVLDPVFSAKSGNALISNDAVTVLKEKLIPICDIVTPNIPETKMLLKIPVNNIEDMKSASKRLYSFGCKAVIIKGGHLLKDAVDVLYDGKKFKTLTAERISANNPHGTGCTFSSALTAGLAIGFPLNEAFEKAKEYVTSSIKNSFRLGKGCNLLNHKHKNFKET